MNDNSIEGEDEKMAVSSEDELNPQFPEFNEDVDMANPKYQL